MGSSLIPTPFLYVHVILSYDVAYTYRKFRVYDIRCCMQLYVRSTVVAMVLLIVVLKRCLANANSRSRSLCAVARTSVCRLSDGNARAPYSDGRNFPQYFNGIRYIGHPLTSTENFTKIVPGKPLRWGS